MWLSSLIAEMRKAVADDPAAAQAVFAALGTLVAVPEADARTQARPVTADESPVLSGPVPLAAPSRTRWPRRRRTRSALTGSGLTSPVSGSARLSCQRNGGEFRTR